MTTTTIHTHFQFEKEIHEASPLQDKNLVDEIVQYQGGF
jgi:hypothetical protein